MITGDSTANTTASQSGTPGNSPIFFHTQGPWRAADGCIYAGDAPIALVYRTTLASRAEADANARLIAASPALLSAVIGLVMAVLAGGTEVLNQAMRQAVASLALVEGSAA